MSISPRIFRDYKDLIANYNTLDRGDIFQGRLPLRAGEEHILVDLTQRGIRLIPSATAQLASRSKVLQSRLFSQWMIPGTRAVYDAHHLLEQITPFQKLTPGRVILKLERKNAGIGVLLFHSIEDIYSHAATGNLPFPFVVQPFFQDAIDIRVIILDDYVEAYTRQNSYSFRNNLHCGGVSAPHKLEETQYNICRQVMARGDFPYAHIDLLHTMDGETHLLEISLRGGIRGAKICFEEYKKRSADIEAKAVAELAAE